MIKKIIKNFILDLLRPEIELFVEQKDVKIGDVYKNNNIKLNYSNEYSGWFDISSNEDVVLGKNETRAIHTGLHICIGDPNYRLQLNKRSGLSKKYGLNILGGCIDSDYQGEILVILQNSNIEEFKISVGDRICEAGFELVLRPKKIKIVEARYLPHKSGEGYIHIGNFTLQEGRKEKGFGSTGLK
jgi:dUTP pyrophosphatase